jgi:hypothetical protein
MSGARREADSSAHARTPAREANPDIVRELTSGELREARWIYRASINFATVRIHRGKWAFWQPDNTAMAPNGHVYFPAPIYRADFSATADSMSFLIHELGHIWQTQSGVWLKLNRMLQGGVYDYGALAADADLKSFKIEQQASIIADWYRLRHDLKPDHGSGDVGSYEAVVRRAIPSETP